MESIAELRNICQTTAKKDVSNVYMRYVSRFFSIYLTRLILPLPVTPINAVVCPCFALKLIFFSTGSSLPG